MKYTEPFSEQIEALRTALAGADAVVIGAGAGLSTAAGYTYGGERFLKYFSDFAAKYRFRDMYTGGFYPFPTPEEYWAYWSRQILVNRYQAPSKPVYEQLLSLVQKKEYFVLTTNVDHCFQRAGFSKARLFYTQGDYGLLQCSVPCHDKTYDNEALIRRMTDEQRDMRVPSELVPKCPVCGAPMIPNLRTDDRFVEDKGWHAACGRYERFLAQHRRGKVLFLELGVGGNTPGIIKYPFWRMCYENERSVYACINRDDAGSPREIEARSICIAENIGTVLSALQQ